MSLLGLMGELQMDEGILKYQKHIHMVVESSLGSFCKKNNNNIETKKQKGKFKARRKKNKW